MITFLVCTGTFAPVQYEGTIEKNGTVYHFYFRARWTAWDFGVGTSPDAAKQATVWTKQALWHAHDTYGTGMDASGMDLADAKALIARCAQLFVADHPWSPA